MKNLRSKIDKLLDSRLSETMIILAILAGAFLVRLYGINNEIADWHSWRQVDTASVSKIFLNEGVDVLHPRYFDISKVQTGYENPEGYRFVEFPIFNVLHAVFSKTFLFISFEAWGRLISITASLFTTFFLYAIGKRQFNKWVGILAAFFYAFIPFNIYFTRVILPDPLAVMLGVASVYFFMHYINDEKLYKLLLSSFMFALSMLVKPHAIFFALPMAYLYFTKHSLFDVFKNKWLFIAADIMLIPFLLWRIWMYRYGLIRGIAQWEWAFNGNGIRFRPSFWMWIFGERIGTLILGIWGLFPFSVGATIGKKINIVHVFLLGAFGYVSLFATANVLHDYYQTFIMPSIALALGCGAYSIWCNKTFNFYISKIGLVFAISMMFLMGFYNIRDNYKINDTGMIQAAKAADKILPSGALVIAPYNGDTTFLYHIGRSGWPVVTTSIDKMISLGADYYVSVNSSDPDTQNFKNRFEIVEENNNYIILNLKQEKK